MWRDILTGCIGIIGAIAGAIVGVLLTYLIQRKSERKRASVDFCKAFEGMMYLLTSIKGQYPFPAISEMIVSHEMAVIAFHPYLRKRKIRAFDEAWKEYHEECKKYLKVSTSDSTFWERQGKGDLLGKLDKVLDIARQN
jgi:hypothetical protein